MAARRYYDVDEVNALIPELEERFRVILQLQSRAHQIAEQLRKQGFDPEQSEERAPAEVLRARATTAGLLEAINDEIGAIGELGGEVKGFDPGLVDFYAIHRGKDVLLCWRFGERKIEFFHDLETGFSGRQPIVSGDEPGKPRLH